MSRRRDRFAAIADIRRLVHGGLVPTQSGHLGQSKAVGYELAHCRKQTLVHCFWTDLLERSNETNFIDSWSTGRNEVRPFGKACHSPSPTEFASKANDHLTKMLA